MVSKEHITSGLGNWYIYLKYIHDIYIYIYIYIHMYTHIYRHVCIYKYTQNTDIGIDTDIDIKRIRAQSSIRKSNHNTMN